MKPYELFYLLAGSRSEEQQQATSREIKSLIEKDGGVVKKDKPWGRKKLAYPIDTERNGFYFMIDFELDSANVNEFDTKLRQHADILRYLLTDKVELTTKEILFQQRALERQKKPETRRGSPSAPRLPRREKISRPAEPEKPKVSLDDLDKKLDEILDKDIID